MSNCGLAVLENIVVYLLVGFLVWLTHDHWWSLGWLVILTFINFPKWKS